MASIMHINSKIMKELIRTTLTVALLIGTLSAFGQRKMVNDQLLWATELYVDGDLSDWGGELKHQNKAQELNYEIRNDEQHLFIAVRIEDEQRQVEAITWGINFMLNDEGKRREGPAVLFPAVDRIAFRAMMSKENENRPDDIRVAGLQSVRGIQVMRMGDLLDGLISLDNQYGVQAVAMIDEENVLCVEMRLPLNLVTEKSLNENTPIAYNVKIGGSGPARGPQGQERTAPSRPMGSEMGRYPGNGSRGGFGSSAPRANDGIWGLLQLAKSE